MNIIEVKNVSLKKRRKQILNNITVSVPKGKIVALIGPNGAGKTSLIRCVMNFYTKYLGKIEIDSTSNKNIQVFSRVGYVPEKENFSKDKVIDFLKDMAYISNIDKNIASKKIDDYAKVFNIEKLLDKKLNSLSSGEKKKIMTIQSLMHEPELLVFDEPTENLDPSARETFYEIVKNQNKLGKTILICTHQLDEIKKIVNHIIYINNGNLKYFGDVTAETNLHGIYKKYA